MCKRYVQRWMERTTGLPWYLWLTDAAMELVLYRLVLWILTGMGVGNIFIIPLIPLWWLIGLFTFVDRLARAVVSYIYKDWQKDTDFVSVDEVLD